MPTYERCPDCEEPMKGYCPECVGPRCMECKGGHCECAADPLLNDEEEDG